MKRHNDETEDKNENEFEHAVQNRIAARKLSLRQAMRGDKVCGGMFALESIANDRGLSFVARTMQEWGDTEEEEEA